MDEHRDLRNKIEGLDLSVPDRNTLGDAFLGRVFDDGHIPGTPGRVYLVHPVAIDGDAVQGQPATLTPDDREVPVTVIGKRAEVGDDLICVYAAGRWMARKGGGSSATVTVGWLWRANKLCRPVVGATVTVRDHDGAVLDEQETDENGEAHVTTPATAPWYAPYTVTAAKEGYTDCGTGAATWTSGVEFGGKFFGTNLVLIPKSLTITCGLGTKDAPGLLVRHPTLNLIAQYQVPFTFTCDLWGFPCPFSVPYFASRVGGDANLLVGFTFIPSRFGSDLDVASWVGNAIVTSGQTGVSCPGGPTNVFVGRARTRVYLVGEGTPCPYWTIDSNILDGCTSSGNYDGPHYASSVATACDEANPVVSSGTFDPEIWSYLDCDWIGRHTQDISPVVGPVSLKVPS